MFASAPRFVLLAAALLLAGCGGGGDGGTTNPPPASTLDNVQVTPATANLAAGASTTLTATGRDASGASLAATTFTYSSNNTAVAAVSQGGVVLGISAGTATITVTGALNGVTKSTTSAITVNGALPSAVAVTANDGNNTFTPKDVALAKGGTVTWTFSSVVHNVDFQGTSGAPSGIGNTSNTSVARTFNNSGSFAYVCTLHSGMSGTVVVP
ncbi:MAG: Ig-like domain-containing protein [Gemmatimonadaceae bacterium]|nr:Ig-like domain-containing protein [Gemmatimonadaceae bacterium]